MSVATQPDLFDTDARTNAETLLRRFLDWFDSAPANEGERKPAAWFAQEARDYLEDPFREPWSNV